MPKTTPSSNAPPRLTNGSILPFVPPSLAEVVERRNLYPTIRKLITLTGGTSNQAFVGGIVSFIAQSEIINFLDDWADDSPHARELAEFGKCVWNAAGLAEQIRPFGPDQLVSKQLFGDLIDQYLAAMTASRRPIAEPGIANFLQTLRVFILVRSFEALRFGLPFESNLQEASVALRKACENSNDPRIELLATVKNAETSFIGFGQDLSHQCEIALTSGLLTPANKKIIQALRTIANGGPWRKARRDSPNDAANTPEYSNDDLWGPDDISPPITWPSFKSFPSGEWIARTDIAIKVDEVDPTASPKANAGIGEGLVFQSVEEVQYLRHSWRHLNHWESDAFHTRIIELINDKHFPNRLGAVLALIAYLCSRSFPHLESTLVGRAVGEDWSLNLDSGTLSRTPTRFDRRWRAEKQEPVIYRWIAPLDKKWEIQLSPVVLQVLREVPKSARKSKDIGELWGIISSEMDLQKWFASTFVPGTVLDRAPLSAIDSVYSLDIFERTFNSNQTRLLASSTRTGLPAASAYGAVSASMAFHALASTRTNSLYEVLCPASFNGNNSAGSELDVNIGKVKAEIEKLIRRVNESASKPDEWVLHHNQLTCLMIVALQACTGARPVRSPFETLNWIDFQRGLVFVEDKVSGPTTSARVCILSSFARALLQDRYLPHLGQLREMLVDVAPTFCSGLDEVLQASPNSRLPLFFFLRSKPDFDWLEATETQLTIESGIDWPLPWNLFRHIHATELPRSGLDAEVVDALLGHGERNAESHGDFSLRVPATDIEAARSHVEALQVRLGLRALALLPKATPLHCVTIQVAKEFSWRTYGSEARKSARRKTKNLSISEAKTEINDCINGRPLDSLSATDWQGIALRMLIRSDGMPHRNASLRYEVFEDFVSDLWNKDRLLTRMRVRYTVLPDPEPLFTDGFVAAPTVLSQARADFDEIANSLTQESGNFGLCAALAAIDMALYSRVAHSKALYSLVCIRKSVKVVRLKGAFWFEWCGGKEWRDGQPVFRTQISPRAARWICVSQNSRKALSELPSVPKALKGFSVGNVHPAGMKDLIDRLNSFVNQMNSWDLPGTDAAYLGGRQLFPAIPHADWYRQCKVGRAMLSKQETPEGAAVATLAEPLATMRHAAPAQKQQSAISSLERCADFLKTVSQVVRSDELSNVGKASEIEKLVMKSPYRHGEVAYALAHFARFLLLRAPKKGQRDRLNADTVYRYLHSLLGPMCDLGHELNLTLMDEEELTDFYVSMVDWWTGEIKREQTPDDLPAELERLSTQERIDDAARRTLEQLEEFHEFARSAYGLEEPDWSQVSADGVGAIGRPGYVLASEYRRALDGVLCGQAVQDLANLRLSIAGVLIFFRRFGLRLSEAIGIYAEDWVEINGAIVLLVRSNPIRGLKTTYSKRQVPLIGTLDPAEYSVIQELLRRCERDHTSFPKHALLPEVSSASFESIRAKLGSQVHALLKEATKNPHTVIHFCRHSFATDVFTLIRGLRPQQNSPIHGATSDSVRRLLLGRDSIDRRGLWAVCRLLGHKSPGISARCYLHGLEEYIPVASHPSSWNGLGPGQRSLLDLDTFEEDSTYGEAIRMAADQDVSNTSELAKLLQFLRLKCQGYKDTKALILTGLDSHIWELFSGTFAKVYERNWAKQDASDVKLGPIVDAPRDADSKPALDFLLKEISVKRFDALAALAGSANQYAGDLSNFDITETIGKRRQIVLFMQSHFEAFAAFARSFGLSVSDVHAAANNALAKEVKEWASAIQNLMCNMDVFGKNFQMDTATTGRPPMRVLHRVALVPADKSEKIDTRIELILIWLAWSVINLQMPRHLSH